MIKKYIALFKVLYNNYDGNATEECGFCFADSFVDVVKYLEDTLYDEDLIEIRHIELCETCPIISEETWNAMQKELREA
jgi:hypothetical protein